MATVPNQEIQPKTLASPAPGPKRIELLPPGLVMEEIVSDRYAAIDGGFPMPVVVQQPVTTTTQIERTTISEADTDSTKSVRASGQFDDSEAESDSNAEFEEVCSRLDELLPEVRENPGWDTSSLVSAFKTPHHNQVDESDGWESIEEELGVSVCELAEDVKTKLKSSNIPAVEQLQQLVGNTQTETIEIGAADPVARSNFAPEPADRPYRNLFSRLRRKQQGLL
jgi:hypothetical protein